MYRSVSVKFRDREVHHPLLRKLVTVFVLTSAAVAVPLGIAWLFLWMFLTPVWLPLHFALKALGRRGFVEQSPSGLKIDVSLNGFRKV